MTYPTTREVIDDICTDATTGDLERFLAWWTDDDVLEDLTLAIAFAGREELRTYLHWNFKVLPGVRYQSIRLDIDDFTAIVDWQQIAQVVETFDEISPSEVELDIYEIDVFPVRDGLKQHEVSWSGDGRFCLRLENVSREDFPPALPLTPLLREDAMRFESPAS